MSSVLIAVDGGGSRTVAAVFDTEGTERARAEAGGSNHLLMPPSDAARAIAGAIDAALRAAGADIDDAVAVCAGLAGVEVCGRGADRIRAFAPALQESKALIVSDMQIAHTAALGGRTGVVALAGSGSVIYGEDEHGKQIKVGGWGPAYGNEGSGYALGRSALAAAARAFDGRGPKTALLDAILERLELRDFRESLGAIYSSAAIHAKIARLGELVDRIANEGDEVARGILREAGADLAHASATAAKRLVGDGRACLVSYQGSAIRCSRILRETFAFELSRMDACLRVEAPQFDPVYGAFLRAVRSVGARAPGTP